MNPKTVIRLFTAALMAACIALAAGYAAAESDAQWKPTQENDPATCAKIWQAIGLPRDAATASDKTTVCHDRFVLSHDNASKTPDWVIEHLRKKELTNKFGRPKEKFSPDPRVPPRGRPDAGDYAGSKDKFEIGHMAPSEDFNNSDVNMRDTFVFSNAVPQAGDRFNAAIWKTLETEVRSAAQARGDVYVITGPVRGNGTERTLSIAKKDNACGGAIELDAIKTAIVCRAVNKKQAATCGTGVKVPVALYKIIYDPKRNAAYAFVMPNRNHPIGLGNQTHAYLDSWRVNVGVVENLTGLQFFRDLPAATREKAIKQCAGEPFWASAGPKAAKKQPQ